MRKYRLEGNEMSLIKKMEYLAKDIEWVISFSQWIPDYDMPEKLKQETSKFILNWDANKYTHPMWIVELRKKVSEFYKSNYNSNFTKNEIVITAWAIEAINSLLLTILTNKNDEVILLDPSYASYNNAIKIAWWKLIYCPTEKDLSLDSEKLKALINKNTKAIIICNPNNPTWWIIENKKIKEVLEFIKETDTYLIIDEVYKFFLLEEWLSFSSATTLFEEYKNNLIIINSWSKTFSITGWRIWYMIACEKLIKEFLKIHDSLVTCAPSFAQYWVLKTIDIIPKRTNKIKKDLINSRHIVLEELEKLTDYIEFEKPKAWYYIFCKLKYTNDDYNECLKILKEAKVSLVPGSAFWKTWKWYFRICFWRESSTLKTWLKRLNKYFYNRKK